MSLTLLNQRSSTKDETDAIREQMPLVKEPRPMLVAKAH